MQLPIENLIELVLLVFLVKRREANKHLVKQSAESIEVGRVTVTLAAKHFRSKVLRRPAKREGLLLIWA